MCAESTPERLPEVGPLRWPDQAESRRILGATSAAAAAWSGCSGAGAGGCVTGARSAQAPCRARGQAARPDRPWRLDKVWQMDGVEVTEAEFLLAWRDHFASTGERPDWWTRSRR